MAVHLVSHQNLHADVLCTTSVITYMHITVAGRLHRAVVDSTETESCCFKIMRQSHAMLLL